MIYKNKAFRNNKYTTILPRATVSYEFKKDVDVNFDVQWKRTW